MVGTIFKESSGADSRRVLLISNGHGEDLLAGVLAQALERRCRELELWAFPIVGAGQGYKRFPVSIVGVQAVMPSGGFLRQSWQAFREDIKAGLLKLTWQQWQALRALRSHISYVVAVGDIYALYLAYRHLAKPLVFVPTAKSDYIRGHLAIEKYLMRKHCQLVLPRDELTAGNLRRSGIPAKYVGNLMMDSIFASGQPLQGISPDEIVIGILPGSRDEVYMSLPLISTAMDVIAQGQSDLVFAMAIAGTLSVTRVVSILEQEGWQASHDNLADSLSEGVARRETYLVKGGARLLVAQGRFGDVLEASCVCLGMAGTANEQAAGLGRPVVAFPGPGSQFTAKFLAAQKRLLGDALAAAEGPEAAGRAVLEILADTDRYAAMAACGRQRMGGPGGADRMATEISRLWDC